MAFYRCVTSCIYLGEHFREGKIKEFASDPGANFAVITGDVLVPGGILMKRGLKGTIFFDGGAGWDDLDFPVQGVKINPATSKPDIDFANVDILFDDSSNETVVGAGQAPHETMLSGVWYPHLHWTQSASGVVKWKLEYKFWDIGDSEPAAFTTLTTVKVSHAYSSGNLGQVSYFDAINIDGFGISFNIKIRVTRMADDAADTMVGDAKFGTFDFHYRKDSFGSGRIWEK